MPVTVNEFKRAFSFGVSNDRLNLDKQTEAAILGLKDLTLALDQESPTTQGYRQTLTDLVTRYAGTKKQNGQPDLALEELSQIYGETLEQITLLRGLSGASAAPSPTAFAPTSNGSPAPPPVVGGTAVKADGTNGAPPPVAKVPPAKPGASSAYLMKGFDPGFIREVNDATDRIFRDEYPNVKEIKPNSVEADQWLTIRDMVLESITNPKPLDKSQRAKLSDEQRGRHLENIEEHLETVLEEGDQITALIEYADDNAIGDKDGTKLMEALSGNVKKLGNLSDDARKGLIQLYAVHWLYSPRKENQEGADDHIAKLTEALKDADPTIKAMVARQFLEVIDNVPGKLLVGANDDIVGKQLDIQSAMRNASIDLDPTGYVQAVKFGEQLAMSVLGNTKRRYFRGNAQSGTGTQTRSEDASLTEERENALILAVANGALSAKETDVFFDHMFNWTSDYDVSPRDSLWGKLFDVDPATVPQQEAMAKLLTKIVNRNHAQNAKDAEDNERNLMAVMKSPGGREVLFSTTMDDAYRKWALDMMSANSSIPGKKPWTAEQLKDGWESPVVVKAYAGAAVKQAEAIFPQPWKLDATKDRGALTNAIGQLLGRKPDNLPKKGETDDEKKKREAEGFNHPLYKLDEKPFKKLLEDIGPGNVMVTGIPVTVMNRQYGASLFQVLRVQKGENATPFFLDHEGNKYDTVDDWKSNKVLPAGRMTFPKDLVLGNPLDTAETKKGSKGVRVMDAIDEGVMKAGMVAGALLLVGTGGAAAPLVAGVAAAYSTVRGVQKIVEMKDRGYDVTDLGDADVRGVYIDIASNAFGAGAMGSTKLIGALTKEGAKISRAGANLIAGLTWAGNLTDAASMAHEIDQLAENWDKMDDAGKASALLSLGFAGAGQGKALKQGGFRGQFDYTRIRNMIENKGVPFPIEQARDGELTDGKKIAVRNDGNGKMTIIHAADFNPRELKNREMLDLHSDVAVAMEASYTLTAKLKRMIAKADPNKPPANLDNLPPGSAAWEAHHELLKIDAELKLNEKKMWNADEKTRKELIARQVELNAAIVKENARLDHWDKAGSGVVAAPAKGQDQVNALGWNNVKVPDGYHWVAGNGEPHLFSPGKEKLYYSRTRKTFITERERAKIEEIAERASEDWFEKTFFDTKLGQKPTKSKKGEVARDKRKLEDDFYNDKDHPVITIHKDGGMPDVLKDKMKQAQFTEKLAKTLNLKTEQLGWLTEIMGKQVSKDFLAAWSRAAARSKVAVEALKKIKLYEARAASLEESSIRKRSQGDTKGADADQQAAANLRESAGDLKEKAYDPVRDKFWDEVYKDKNMHGMIEAAGLKFEKGKAPYLEVPDPKNPGQVIKMEITLEHAQRKTDVPSRAQDPDNLLFSFRHENTDLLERIRDIMRWRMENPKGPQPDWKDSGTDPKPPDKPKT